VFIEAGDNGYAIIARHSANHGDVLSSLISLARTACETSGAEASGTQEEQ
jgi:hypothetical protein